MKPIVTYIFIGLVVAVVVWQIIAKRKESQMKKIKEEYTTIADAAAGLGYTVEQMTEMNIKYNLGLK
jgi:hypothetical protein